jgi:predicted nucleotidyltransferase component of viral defense system
MPNDILTQMLSRYEIRNASDQHNALHEIMQQIVLAGLYRANFFDVAAFYGGTCLRIFHGLPRFSEDMDFSLTTQDAGFSLDPYFQSIIDEFKLIGRSVTIKKKNKTATTNVESAFLKDDTAIYDLKFVDMANIKIKIEVDTKPPLPFSAEYKLLLLPFSFMAKCYSLPDAYAGKMHALLFRNWKNRVKGRDWYDFEWYVRNGAPLNFTHFRHRTEQFGQIKENEMTKEIFERQLRDKIAQTDIEKVKTDVLPFIKDPSVMDIWTAEYFNELVEMIRYM